MDAISFSIADYVMHNICSGMSGYIDEEEDLEDKDCLQMKWKDSGNINYSSCAGFLFVNTRFAMHNLWLSIVHSYIQH